MTELLLLSRDTDSSVGEKVLICAAGLTPPTTTGGCSPIPLPMLATESEEVGVEHLLRDVKDTTVTPSAAVMTSSDSDARHDGCSFWSSALSLW